MLTNMQNSGNYVRLDNSFDAKTTATAIRTTTETTAAAAIVADVVVGGSGSDTDYSMFVAHDYNNIIDNNNYNSHNSHNKNINHSNQTNYSYNNSNNINHNTNNNTNNNNTHHLVHHVSEQTIETSVGPLFQSNNNNNNNNINNHNSDEKTVKDGYKNSTKNNNNNKQNFLVDAEQTMEVPLLNCNNNNNNNSDDDDDNHYNNEDYDMQQRHHHHQGDEDHLQHFCLCHQRGFGVSLMDKSTQEAKLKIILAISLCVVFMIIEFLGGYLAGSLAIVTDAAHLASDCISFMVGLIAIWLGSRPPDARMSFGYKRTEVMGALISIWSIWILTAALVLAALQRLYSNDYDLDAKTMMIISAIGIVINIVMARILHGSSLLPVGGAHGHAHSHTHSHAHSELHTHADTQLMVDASSDASGSEALFTNESCEKNLNLRAAMIHVIGDLVQSVGIFLAAVFIHYFPSAKFMDPLCTILFSVIVLLTTVGLFRESIRILADAVPLELSIEKLETDLSNIEGVKSVHHLNVWKHTTNHNVMMVHLIIDFLSDNNTVLNEATKLASNHKYNIKHSTIQIERLTA